MMEDSNASMQWYPFDGPIQLLASSRTHLGRRQNDGLPHVLLVLDQFPKILGGGEKIALRMAKLLPQYGYRVSILTFDVHPESSLLQDHPPCPVFLLPLTKTYDFQALRAARALAKLIPAQNIQLVQTFFESSDLWAGLIVKAFTKAKLIWSRRDMGILRGRKHQIAYRLMSKLPDRVFAVSDKVRTHAIKIDRIKPERVETIYNGLDLNDGLRHPDRRANASLSVITVGNIRHVKGFDVLIQAAAIIVKSVPHVHFRIAGGVLEPDCFKRLTTMIADSHLERHVSFLGSVTELGPYLNASNLFVLPSRSEGFSNAIIEAMAHSLPVVATRVGGNDEAVEDGVTGYIVPSEDAPALAEALMRALQNPLSSEEMGARGKLRVSERFTTAAMMTRTAAVYNRLLGRPFV
ncbi:Glycosyltransferase involved in cell wall bisynthesis [Granulicella pectinivorans]|uniref:Glycosyltransferase involved in cell wall bisynthesis n=1 Tax=Granulicella pectinivorans TaxID=474950 RepID=A0A1I6MMB8_9BACT|nr:glycosyltransferase family 4 protein [Granulicella pectinivorans]SFS16794.1 Glycosyltransferase involved in cell wall bisynthesis [Granulicella pectinivorans]